MTSETKDGRLLALVWCQAALAFVVLLPFLAPLLLEILPSCLLRNWTGMACPLCGTTRAALSLSRLEFGHALITYPLPAVFWILFVTGGLAAGFLRMTGRGLPQIRLPRFTGAAVAVLVVLNWIYSIATGV